MRISKSKIAFITNNLNRFNVVLSLTTSKGNKPVIDDYTMDNVSKIINSLGFFKSIGGYERMTFEESGNGDNSLLTINLFSRSPDKQDWTNRNIVITCDSDTIYTLSNC